MGWAESARPRVQVKSAGSRWSQLGKKSGAERRYMQSNGRVERETRFGRLQQMVKILAVQDCTSVRQFPHALRQSEKSTCLHVCGEQFQVRDE